MALMIQINLLICWTVASVAETGFGHIFYPVQNRGKFLWTVISKTCPRIIRSKLVVLESEKFRLYACMPSSTHAQLLNSFGHFSELGVEIALSHRHVDFFG